MMRLLGRFVIAVLRRWTTLLTGGYLVAVVTFWAYTGHTIDPRINQAVVVLGLIGSFFLVWKDEVGRAAEADARITELTGRPDVALEAHVITRAEALARIGGLDERTLYEFVVRNGGPVQAVSVSIDDLVLPMNDKVKIDAVAMQLAYLAESGKKIDEMNQEKGWDQWVIKFETVSSITSGTEAGIPFHIGNMGPLQKQDICWPMQNTERTLSPLKLPLVLRFSNRDGYAWEQRYELTHKFKCHISLEFKGMKLVKRPSQRP